MNKSLTLIQRVLSDTPIFFKVLNIIAYVVILAATVMAKLNFGTAGVQSLLATVGFVIMAVSQCAAKDAALFSQGITVQGTLETFNDVTNTASLIKAELATPAPLPTLTDAIKSVTDAVNGDTAKATAPNPIDDAMAKAASQLSIVKD
jgi:hypothetical protein